MYDRKAIKHDFSKSADDYQHNAILQQQIHYKTTELAMDYFPPHALILDVGCGSVPLQGKWKVIGLDISYGMCKEAAKNTMTINSDAANLPFATGSIDGVFSSLFLQWADNPKHVITETMRVLKPSGTAIMTCFIDGTLAELKEAFSALDTYPHVSDFITSDELYNIVLRLDGQILFFEEKQYIEEYKGVIGLMRSIKNIGANNKLVTRKKGLMTPRQLKILDKHYDKMDGIIEATWNVLTIVIGKP